MSQPNLQASCPLSRRAAIDLYFLEHRAKLLDLAAFLDRLDRCQPDADAGTAEDYRVAALRTGIAILLEASPGRAKRIQELLSDPSDTPIPAAGIKGASGAYLPGAAEGKPARAKGGAA